MLRANDQCLSAVVLELVFLCQRGGRAVLPHAVRSIFSVSADILTRRRPVLYDATGKSWTIVFIVAAILNIVAAVAALVVLRPLRLRHMGLARAHVGIRCHELSAFNLVIGPILIREQPENGLCCTDTHACHEI
jgi:hypothetical protein